MTFLAWPEIESFHHIRKFLQVDPAEWWRGMEQLHGTSVVEYRCKVKLHGTNAAVQIHMDGTIICQSRESIITREKDNAGFARWVMSNADEWQRAQGYVVYGEWCGPGIQKSVAISDIPKKVFAVFAARALGSVDSLIVEPDQLREIVKNVSDTYVLPWHTHTVAHDSATHVYSKVDVDWKKTDEGLAQVIAPINDWVLAIEANDPWVESTFGVKGTGEGLVFYPVSKPHLGWENFQNLVFKAKGEKHKNIKTQKPAQVNPETAASVDAFCDLVLTEARLEQGANAVAGGKCTYDMQMLGKFIGWIIKDVEKETQDELTASGLTFKEVQKSLTDKARNWYKAKS